jgi:redox-sensitive bicupin YhaK (pirin superfamily)
MTLQSSKPDAVERVILSRVTDLGDSLEVNRTLPAKQRRHAPVPIYSDAMYVDVILEPGEIPSDHEERAMYQVAGAPEAVEQEATFSPSQLTVSKPRAELGVQTKTAARVMQAIEDWRAGRFADIPGETEFIVLPAGF